MRTPHPRFNGFIATAFLGLATLCSSAQAQAPADPQQAPPPTRAIGLCAVIEPYYQHLFSELKTEYAADLVPPLTIARDRLLDMNTGDDKEKKAVYDLGAKLLENMKVVADERTQYLGALLKTAARPSSSLETTKSMSSSNQHFLTLQLQKGNDALKRKKPALDAMFTQLRTAERAWNTRLPEGTRAENYKFKALPYPIISYEAQARQNPLEQKSYDQKQAIYPWRSSYYGRYGSPRSN